MIRAILACDEKYGIGKNGTIPWNHKDDMRFFKMATIGWGNNVVVMGRITKESLPKFPLPDRGNLVISTTEGDFSSLEDFEVWVKNSLPPNFKDVWIIGGASIYNKSFKMKLPEEIYLTLLNGDYECDTFIDMDIIKENYKIQDSREIEDYKFQVWERK